MQPWWVKETYKKNITKSYRAQTFWCIVCSKTYLELKSMTSLVQQVTFFLFSNLIVCKYSLYFIRWKRCSGPVDPVRFRTRFAVFHAARVRGRRWWRVSRAAGTVSSVTAISSKLTSSTARCALSTCGRPPTARPATQLPSSSWSGIHPGPWSLCSWPFLVSWPPCPSSSPSSALTTPPSWGRRAVSSATCSWRESSSSTSSPSWWSLSRGRWCALSAGCCWGWAWALHTRPCLQRPTGSTASSSRARSRSRHQNSSAPHRNLWSPSYWSQYRWACEVKAWSQWVINAVLLPAGCNPYPINPKSHGIGYSVGLVGKQNIYIFFI